MKNIHTRDKQITLENLIDEVCNNGYKDDVLDVLRSFKATGADDVHPLDLSEVISKVQFFATCN